MTTSGSATHACTPARGACEWQPKRVLSSRTGVETKSHISCCMTAKSNTTKHITSSLNPASYETHFLLHNIAQGFFAINSRQVIRTYRVQYICPLHHVCFTFRAAFSETSARASVCTYTRTCVAWMRSCLYVLTQATKHASMQCVCKSHPDFQGEQLAKTFATDTRINMVFKELHETGPRAGCGSRAAGWPGLV